MNDNIRYALDDTILDNPVRKTSIKIKGVTYFDRQNNLKKLYDMHYKKEDKHLTLEKYYVGKTETLCVLFNGLEIGTIPEEQLRLFYSPSFTYELNNIHIDTFDNEKGKTIYWAVLYVIFKPKEKVTPSPKIHSYTTSIPASKPIIQNTKAPIYNTSNIQQNKTKERTSKKDKPDITTVDLPSIGKIATGGSSDEHSAIIPIVVSLLVLAGCIYYSIVASPFFLIGALMIIICIIIFSTSLRDSDTKETHPNTDISPYHLQNISNEESRIIQLYRKSSEEKRINTLLHLSLEPTPEKKKKTYKEYSKKEVAIINAYRNSSKTIQLKVKEILNF